MIRALLIGCAIAASAGCGDSKDRTAAPPTARVLQPMPPPDLKDPAKRAARVGYIGVISARGTSDVMAKVEGELSAVHVRLGDVLAQGDPIAEVDDAPLREELAVAKATLRSVRASIAQTKVDIDEAVEKLAIENRAFAQGTTSKKNVVDAKFRHKKALAARDRAQASLGEQRARITQLERKLSQAKITAPFAGTISLRHLDPGAIVSPGTPIVRLITADDLWVKFAVPGDDAGRLAAGQSMKVAVEALGVTLEATVRQIAPELDPTSQMIIVEAELVIPEDLTGRIQSGLVARVRHAEP